MNLITFFLALAMIESSNNPNAIGDLNTRYPAYGLYQIRQPYLSDVTSSYKREMVMKWGHILILSEMKEKLKAQWVVQHYLEKYGNRYRKKTGLNPSLEVYVRIHNGGPNGWKNKVTKKYWIKFDRQYDLYASNS